MGNRFLHGPARRDPTTHSYPMKRVEKIERGCGLLVLYGIILLTIAALVGIALFLKLIGVT